MPRIRPGGYGPNPGIKGKRGKKGPKLPEGPSGGGPKTPSKPKPPASPPDRETPKQPSNPFTPPGRESTPPRAPERTTTRGVGTIASGGDRTGYLKHYRSPENMKRGHNQGAPTGTTGTHPQINDPRITNPISDPKGFTKAISEASRGGGGLSKPRAGRSAVARNTSTPTVAPGLQTPVRPVSPRMQAQGLTSDIRALRSGLGTATNRSRPRKAY